MNAEKQNVNPGSWCDPDACFIWFSADRRRQKKNKITIPYFRYRLWWRSSLSMVR